MLSVRRRRSLTRYGITLEVYEELMSRGCAICGETQKRIVMDHCHASGRNRGPLCDGCNVGLGGFRDRPEMLRAAADYLEHHAARNVVE